MWQKLYNFSPTCNMIQVYYKHTFLFCVCAFDQFKKTVKLNCLKNELS